MYKGKDNFVRGVDVENNCLQALTQSVKIVISF